MRECEIITDSMGFYRAVFNSGGRRVKRLITPAEKEKLEKLLESGDEFAIDSFCYKIA